MTLINHLCRNNEQCHPIILIPSYPYNFIHTHNNHAISFLPIVVSSHSHLNILSESLQSTNPKGSVQSVHSHRSVWSTHHSPCYSHSFYQNWICRFRMVGLLLLLGCQRGRVLCLELCQRGRQGEKGDLRETNMLV